MTRLPEVSKDELTTEDKIGEIRESEGGLVTFDLKCLITAKNKQIHSPHEDVTKM